MYIYQFIHPSQADIDQDNELTKEEILDKYDLFVGSQVGAVKNDLRI